MAQTVEFQFSPLVLAIPFGIAGICVLASVVLAFYRKWVLAVVLLMVAALPGLIFGPAMWMDRVVVTQEQIEQRTGFPWSQTVKGFRFEDVSFVQITDKPVGPKQRISQVWEVHEKDGITRDVDPGDLWETNGEEIVRLLTQRGVEFRE